MSRLNVYQMIFSGAFDTPDGLWVVRDSWGDTVARVTGYEPLEGPPPYFRNQAVTVDLYYRRGVRYKTGEPLSCPGTFAYRQIGAPIWWAAGQNDQYGVSGS